MTLRNSDVYEQLRTAAQLKDNEDPLAHKRAEFELPSDVYYLDGNSLGPLTHKAKKRAREVIDLQWGESLIASWNTHNWISLPSQVGNKIEPLIGARENSVICCDSISVNLFKVLSAALSINAPRTKILSQADNFPTDLYMAQGLSNLLGQDKCELISVDSEQIINSIHEFGQEASILMLTHVNYKNGKIFDMAGITKLAHEYGILVVWDLAHSTGVLPVYLEECSVDFAVGCTYKYLNGGPGAPGFVYASAKHLPKLNQALSGWMGHAKPFDFKHDYQPNTGIEQFLSGTPPIVSLSVLDAAMDIFSDVRIEQIREKSISLNQFFMQCSESFGIINELALACEQDSAQRGSQISFKHQNAYAICQALISRHVIPDFRAPNILRLGFSPLFLSHQDILQSAMILADLLESQEYTQQEYSRKQAVT